VIASAKGDGPPADTIVTRYFKARRYAGSKDRRAVRELVFRGIRRSAEVPASGRAAILGLSEDEPQLRELFGQPRGPEPLGKEEAAAPVGLVPEWLEPELSPLVGEAEWPALLERAPLDLRVNAARTTREEMLGEFEGASATTLSPWGIRLPADTRIDDHPAFQAGLIEVQDEGSQLIALACSPAAGQRILDLCAGAGGKALALAAAAQEATILATDVNRARLAQLPARAERAGVAIETRLLNPPREFGDLADWRESADVVLVDAPCSGSGTLRRNPDLKWRFDERELERVNRIQGNVLRAAARLVKRGGRLVYATCSLLEMENQLLVERFLAEHPEFRLETAGEILATQGIEVDDARRHGPWFVMLPHVHGTDGFFAAALERSR